MCKGAHGITTARKGLQEGVAAAVWRRRAERRRVEEGERCAHHAADQLVVQRARRAEAEERHEHGTDECHQRHHQPDGRVAAHLKMVRVGWARRMGEARGGARGGARGVGVRRGLT